MTADPLDPPVVKLPDPLAVPQIYALLLQSGLDWKDMQMLWMGSHGLSQRYHLIDAENQVHPVEVISFVQEDEKIIFRAFQDWFAGAIRKFAESARGYFTFDVIQFEMGSAPWSWADLTSLLLAHSKKLNVGERRLIQFGPLWGVLHKRTEADWGKVESKLELAFCKFSVEALARFIKKQISRPGFETVSSLVLRDLSQASFCEDPTAVEFLSNALRPKNSVNEGGCKIFYYHSRSKRLVSV